VKRLRVRVDSGSLVHIDRNAYSVDSRLIGQKLEAHLHMEHIDLYLGRKRVARLPRLRGRQQHRVNYRHVIDSLVRKPGAFAHYRYREELFPSTIFRMAYDRLKALSPSSADRQYLKILELAAKTGEGQVSGAIEQLCQSEAPLSFEAVEAMVAKSTQPLPQPREVEIGPVNLEGYDMLLEGSGEAEPAGEEVRP
jgi:hypothetical protein